MYRRLYHLSQAFQGILAPHWTDDQRDEQHTRDLTALCFSVDLNGAGLQLSDFPRFGQLVSQHRKIHRKQELHSCFPRLVSFIGMTGAGKSTLIHMLMERLWEPGDRPLLVEAGLAIPVVGKRGDSNLTSGDVHLYLDPYPETPIFFADCEGFHGGESDPAGSKARKAALEAQDQEAPEIPEMRQRYEVFRETLEYFRRGISRTLRLPSRFSTSSPNLLLQRFSPGCSTTFPMLWFMSCAMPR
jgi:hypothetical protein